MTSLRELLRESAGLFVDDGSLALALIGWLAAAAALAWARDLDAVIEGCVLFGRCAIILVENVLRRARKA
jgi:hypothetical protein